MSIDTIEHKYLTLPNGEKLPQWGEDWEQIREAVTDYICRYFICRDENGRPPKFIQLPSGMVIPMTGEWGDVLCRAVSMWSK